MTAGGSVVRLSRARAIDAIGFAAFQTLERKQDRLDLVPELMGERAEKIAGAGFRKCRLSKPLRRAPVRFL